MSKKGIYYNIPDGYKFSTAFENVKVKPLVSEDRDKYLSLASAANLKKFLPKDLPEDNIGLLAWSGNFCVANKINLNSDCISTKEAIHVSRLLPYTYVDLEHAKSTILGVILTAGFSEYGTDKPLTEDEIKDYTKPFNITVGGVIWRVVNENFADAVEEMGQPDSKEKVSISWEIAFSNSNLILIDKDKSNLEDGKIISDAAEISKLENNLQAFGGSGFIEGKRIARLIIDEPLPLGAGFVSHPAGQVGTIVTENTKIQVKASYSCPECGEEMEMEDDEMDEDSEVSCAKCGKKSMGKKWKSKANKTNRNLPDNLIKILKNLPESGMGYHICDLELKDGTVINNIVISNCSIIPDMLDGGKVNHDTVKNLKISQISNSQLEKQPVNQINNNKDISKNMTIKSLKELNDESLKTATAPEIIKAHKVDLDAEVEKISKEWEAKRDEVKNKLSEAEQKNAELEAKAQETADKLAKVQEDLNKLIKAAQDKEAEDIFSARMNYFDAEYELDEKSRNAVANRIKGLDEAGYKQEKEDLEVLLAAKKRGIEVKEEKKEVKASVEKVDDKTTSTVVEDAIDKGMKVVATVAATTTVTESNADKFAKAFGKDNWVIDPRVLRK